MFEPVVRLWRLLTCAHKVGDCVVIASQFTPPHLATTRSTLGLRDHTTYGCGRCGQVIVTWKRREYATISDVRLTPQQA